MIVEFQIVGNVKEGANPAGCVDGTPTHVSTVGSGSFSGHNTPNSVSLRSSSDEVQKSLLNPPQLQHCNSMAERSQSMAPEGDP